ncbi:MAG: heparan-alpha-glucosaminide N-acetyltransferase domain-containing protein [Chitinophagaceae bacterium]
MRIKEIDIARGFTVFIMAAVHAVLIYSTPEVHASWLGDILFFLAEGPGAPLFMMVMGISFVLSRKTSVSERLRRAALLLLLAYVLNFLKFLVPLAAGGIPQQLLADFGIPPGSAATWHFLLLGDILQLAAIALTVLTLLHCLRNYHYWAMAIAFIILIVTPFLWQVNSANPVLNYIFDLLWGFNSRVYFPAFPWLVYPLTGMAAGYYLQTSPGFFAKARNIGLLLIGTGLIISSFDPAWHWGDFYRTAQGGTLYYIGFVLLWLYLCHLAVKLLPDNSFFTLLTRLSRHITRIYLIQWVLVFWLIGLIGYRQLNIIASLVCIVLITSLVILIGLLPEKLKKLQLYLSVIHYKRNKSVPLVQPPE